MVLWAGEKEFGGHGAVTTYMAVPEPLEVVLWLASTLAGAAAVMASVAMFVVTAMAVFVPVNHDGSL
jgi:hypothetical protein